MRTRAVGVRIAFLIPVAAVLAWAVPRHPVYQEWRLSHLPLEQLERERGNQMDDFRLLYYTGLRLNERGRFADALPLLLQAARLEPDEARIRDALAQAQIPLGNTGEAFNQLAQYAGTHPDSADGHLYLGKFYLAMKSGKRALGELERAVALNPNLAEGWSALASARSEFTPDKAAAVAAARRAAGLRLENAGDHLRLATLLSEQSAPEARTEFQRALALAPNRADIRRLYADYLLSTGDKADLAAAETEARRAVALDADAPLAYLTLGRALAQRHVDTEAMTPLLRAAALDPYDTVAPHELVRLFRRRGDQAETAKWQKEWQQRQEYLRERQKLLDAALASPQDRACSLRLAQLLGRHGEMSEALRYQGIAQNKPADAPPVLLATARDLMTGGFADRAAPLANRVLETATDPTFVSAARHILTITHN